MKELKKYNYEILFKDSLEYFIIKNSNMIQENNFVRFLKYDLIDSKLLIEEEWYPIDNIFKIKRYDNK